MKIVQINSVCGSGSTGRICTAVSQLLTEENIENYIYYAIGDSAYPLGNKYMSLLEVKFQAFKSRIFGNYGFQSKAATKRLIKNLEKISPDVIQLHNLHSHNVHLGLLFSYFKKRKIKVFWTFHDCWSITAYCPHYYMIGCDKWKKGCVKCPVKRHYSWIFDRSKYLYKKKKELFSLPNMTIITPSKWLATQVEQSFLYKNDIKIIHNGVDLSVFKYTESDFRRQYNLQNKFIILGCAFGWGKKKGLDVFIELSKLLPSQYQIVLVGTNAKINKQLPDNILSICCTQNQTELAKIYSAADLFINPTREEVFGLVNVEALACGTPVLTFDTGGSPETIDETCGSLVAKDDIIALKKEIIRICTTKPYSKEACLKRAQLFDYKEKFNEYIKLYINSK